MPLAPPAGSAPAPVVLPSPPDYFSSLAALGAYCLSPSRRNRHAAPQIPYEVLAPTAGAEEAGKLLVCHDYKGGYCDNPFERGFTFSWWSLTDCFIYFSHHRVSMPPPSWIRTAHRNGTKILGTLIFEWDAGVLDIVELVLGERRPAVDQEAFAVFDTRYADMLVDLAVERGFEGWLVNVEVELGLDSTRGKVGVTEHVQALICWLEYLTAVTKRRVPGGETLWYDGVTTEGIVRWQNRLTPLNYPFLSACDGLFLNYFWHPSFPAETASVVDHCQGRRRDEVYFGIDVWGRSQWGGGGFETWRALGCITGTDPRYPSLPPSTLSLDPPASAPSLRTAPPHTTSLSIALFAPGWTVEFEDFGHELTTAKGYRRWRDDEEFFWIGGGETTNVSRERTRMMEVRRQQRGVERARMLGRAIGSKWPGRCEPALAPFSYDSPLPTLPGSFRPLISYRQPRPPSSTSTFYTIFSNGSGHAFFVQGKQDFTSASGWTDIDFAFPLPTLFWKSSPIGARIALVENDGWLGAGALAVETTSGELPLPLCAISVFLRSGLPLRATVVWKPLSTNEVGLSVQLAGDGGFVIYDTSTSDLAHGWRSTSALVTSSSSDLRLTSIGISLPSPSSLLLGSISLAPSYHSQLPQPVVRDLIWDSTSRMVRWDVARAVPPLASVQCGETVAVPRGTRWPEFSFFTLWFLAQGKVEKSEAVFLGTTAARQFGVGEGGRGGRLLCRGVREDGEIVGWDRAVSVAI